MSQGFLLYIAPKCNVSLTNPKTDLISHQFIYVSYVSDKENFFRKI